jgi:hypothetical protein
MWLSSNTGQVLIAQINFPGNRIFSKNTKIPERKCFFEKM